MSLSFLLGQVIPGDLGQRMNTFAAEEATKEIRKGFSSQLGADVESAALTKTPMP